MMLISLWRYCYLTGTRELSLQLKRYLSRERVMSGVQNKETLNEEHDHLLEVKHVQRKPIRLWGICLPLL